MAVIEANNQIDFNNNNNIYFSYPEVHKLNVKACKK